MAVIIAAAILVVLITVYVSLGMYFKNHFRFRTVINGVNCSGKTVAAVENLITEEISNYQLEILGQDEQSEVITSVDIDLKPVFDGSLKEILKSQKAFSWPVALFRKTTVELETMVTYDEEKLQSKIDGLNCLKESNSKKAENAYISGYTKGKGFQIMPEKEGTEVDAAALKEVLHTSIINLQKKLSLNKAGCYLAPEICSDSEVLTAALEAANACLDTVITYKIGDKKEVLDSSDFKEWLSVTADNQIAVDEEKAAAFVKELASEYNTYGKTRTFKTSYDVTVTFPENKYGWRIDQSKETAQLIEDIKTGTEVSREPVYAQRAKNYGENDYGGTYVEINITAQHLFFYKDGSLMLETDIITGNLAKGWGTPSGAYAINYKVPGKTLRGPGYAVWVDYWMPFNGGIGLHDCTWQKDFGGTFYKENGSHGCINIPPQYAKIIFNNVKAGDPVFVYEITGTESDKGLAQEAAKKVTSQIAAIGTVTLDSASAIQGARVGYDSLSDLGKKYVKNYDTLVSAESAYKALADERQAGKVIEAIKAIGEPVTADSKTAIEAARKQYDALNEEAKKKVTNYDSLKKAELELAQLTGAETTT